MATDSAMVLAQDATRPPVALVTALALAGDLGDDEYRQIYARVAAGRSLRNIELALHSGVTFGWWAKYANGEKGLDRERKNELRRWARSNGGPELADLPPTPAEVVAGQVHPDAAVFRVGGEIASRMVLVGSDVAAVLLRINGNCAVVDADAPLTLAQGAGVAGCSARYSRSKRASIHLSVELQKRLNERRVDSGLSWEEFLGRLVGE